MKIQEIQKILNAEILTQNYNLDEEVFVACGCDLMSDVLKFAKDDGLLLTGLVNIQVVNTADMANMRIVIFVRSKKPSSEIVKYAEETGITLMQTSLPLFEACGLLYENGLIGAEAKC